MIVNATWSNVVFGLVTLLVFCIIGVSISAALLFTPDFSRNTEQEARFMQYQAAAEQFKGRMYDFDGVCSELILAEGVICADEEISYRVLERHKENGYYCIDHTGFAGQIPSPPASVLACNL